MSDQNNTIASSLPFTLIDVLLLGCGLFLFSQAAMSFQAGEYLTAAADLLLGFAGFLFGIRSTLEHIVDRELPLFNQAAIASFAVGAVLFVAGFFM